MSFLGFLSMADNYESRKIDRYDGDNFFISTAEVTDTDHPYETAIKHPDYNNNSIVIVEMYDTRQEAEEGHKKWITTMTADDLPKQLCDVSSAWVADFLDEIDGDGWRVYKRT